MAVSVAKVDGGSSKKQVTLFVNGKIAAIATIDFYSRPDGTDLFIGVTNGDPGGATPKLSGSILSNVQEVALYRKALSADEIENHATFKVQS